MEQQLILPYLEGQDLSNFLVSTGQRRTLYMSVHQWYYPRGLNVREDLPMKSLFFLADLANSIQQDGSVTRKSATTGNGSPKFEVKFSREAVLPFTDEEWRQLWKILLDFLEPLPTHTNMLQPAVNWPSIINLLFVRTGASEATKEQVLRYFKERAWSNFGYTLHAYVADPFMLKFSFNTLQVHNLAVMNLPWAEHTNQLSNLILRGLQLDESKFAQLNFEPFTFVRFLDLSHNQFHTVPLSPAAGAKLIRLDLSYNQLTSFPTDLLYWTRLQRLDLSHNRFAERVDEPSLYNSITHLEHLDLSYCELRQVPPPLLVSRKDITGTKGSIPMNELKYLNLSYNYLTELELGNQAREARLLASHNRIAKLTTVFWALTSYVQLDLSHNRIQTYEYPKDIYILDISYNPLINLQLVTATWKDLSKFDEDLRNKKSSVNVEHTLLSIIQ